MSTVLTGTPPGTPQQPSTDPLLHPDPTVAAEHAAAETLLRCWVRETGATPDPDGVLRVPVLEGAAWIVAPVSYWSPCGWHRFGTVTLDTGGAAESVPPGRLDAVTLAALIGATTEGGEGGHLAALVAQVADSVVRTADILAYRRTAADPGHLPFLRAEQALLLGHPQHPAPKGRDGLAPAQSAAYSPETHGAFRLHWWAVDRELLAADSAEPLAAEQLTARLLGDPTVLPPGTAALPLHPWQAGELALRPAVAALLEQGLLHDLGPHGEPWHPTSSVRTVLRPGTPWMLKLSLGLRITNSRRENLRKELHRGLEVHRLLEAGLAAEWRAAHPGFDIVRDTAWIGLDAPGLTDPTGLDTVLRRQPFGPENRVHCVAGLVAEQPLGDTLDSALAGVLRGLAAHTAQPLPAVAADWFRRYLDAVVLPILWLDGQGGIALEAHQQNTLILLDDDGWPVGGRYRDNQGYYFRQSKAGDLSARLPGIGAASDTFVPDQVADERFCYYLGINHLLGLIGAFGSQRLADEDRLLGLLRRFLAGPAAAATGSRLPAHLLDAPTLRCKANLLTRLKGLDELVGPVSTQSVYVTLPNPVAAP
ncbi:IucA/IucC family protein [Streptomyces sp. NPDC006339]|uniref:IucA/IucC family protein n=1 Tax=Streptomyces sp. NPDC006339 TaxID=3156755 RepID=UPI0033ADDAE6